jgi:predicted GIY-YIG superfamily endonuclease
VSGSIPRVALIQPRLIPDPQPLVEKLGREFFRALPARPGVYFLRSRAESVLYIGKAKSLRQRLCSYRVVNPDRMPRRILRLVHLVESIVFEECADETAALSREAELLWKLRPKFNRAGVWRPTERFVAWRAEASGIELGVLSTATDGWISLGAFRSRARFVMQALGRIAWCRMQPARGLAGMPCGWWRGRADDRLWVPGCQNAFRQLLADLADAESAVFSDGDFWAKALADDVEFLRERL